MSCELQEDGSSERNHFKIGEVADLVGVRPHVLRYWEQEFPALRPKKTRGAHRHYSRANLELAREIRALVVDQGYSIAGARRQLAAHGRSSAASAASADASLRVDLVALRAELTSLLSFLQSTDDVRASGASRETASDEPVAVDASTTMAPVTMTVPRRR